MTDELLNERYALAIERIRQIPAEKAFRSRTAIFCTDGTVPLQNGPDPEQNRRRISKNSIRGRAGWFLTASRMKM